MSYLTTNRILPQIIKRLFHTKRTKLSNHSNLNEKATNTCSPFDLSGNTSRVDFQANTDGHINMDSRNFYARKYYTYHLFKQLSVCYYALTKLKINDYKVCGKGKPGTRNPTGN